MSGVHVSAPPPGRGLPRLLSRLLLLALAFVLLPASLPSVQAQTAQPTPAPALPGDPIRCPDGGSRTWTPFAGGPQPGRFAGARGMAIEPNGTLIVADSGGARLQRLSVTGELVGEIPLPAVDAFTPASPVGRAVDAAGLLYVGDSAASRVLQLSPDGVVLSIWQPETQEGRQTRLLQPVTVGGGFLYFAAFESGTPRSAVETGSALYRVTLASGLVTRLGRVSENVVSGLTADDTGYIYVAEYAPRGGGSLVRKLTPDGEVVSVWDQTGQMISRPSWMTTSPDGVVYVVNREGWSILAFTQDGDFLGEWRSAQVFGIAVDRDGVIYGAGGHSEDGRPISRYAPTGERLASIGRPSGTPGDLTYPSAMRFDEAGRLHILNGRVEHVYSPSGEILEAYVHVELPERSAYDTRYAFGPAGDILRVGREQVLDQLSNSGEVIRRWQPVNDGRGGNLGRGQIDAFAMARDGRVYLGDDSDLFLFGPDGQQLRRIVPEDVDRWAPRGRTFDASVLTLDRDGNLYAGGGGYLYKLAPDGTPLARWGETPPLSTSDERPGLGVYDDISALAVDERGYVYMVSHYGRELRMLGPDGQLLAVWGSLTTPQRAPVSEFPGGGQHLTLDAAGNLYVVTRSVRSPSLDDPVPPVVWRLGCTLPS